MLNNTHSKLMRIDYSIPLEVMTKFKIFIFLYIFQAANNLKSTFSAVLQISPRQAKHC
jgi:hypothetical protein